MGKLIFLILFISLSVHAVLLDGVKVTNTGASPVPVVVSGTPTVNLGTLNGAATSANQTLGISKLTSMDVTLSSLLTYAQSIESNTSSFYALTDTQLRATPLAVSLASIPTHAVTQSGAWNVGLTGTLPAFAATPTFNIGTIGTIATESTLSALNTKIPASPAQDRTTAVAPSSIRLSDGTAFYKATTPSDTQPISASSLPLPTGAATETTLSALNTKVTAVNTGAVVISSSALPTGAATSALQTSGNSSLSSIDTKTPALVSGRVPVDGSGVTQPVNGTVTANIGTSGSLALDATLTGGSQKAIARGGAKGTTTAADVTSTNVDANTQALDVSVKSLPSVTVGSSALPTGAATEATLSSLNSKVTTVNTGAIAGTVTANAGTNLNTSALNLESTQSAMSAKLPATLGQKTMANSMAVVIASDQSAIPITGSITASNPSVSATGVAVPASATMVGATDGTNLRAIKSDANGELQVDVLTLPSVTVGSSTLPTGAATETTLSSINTKTPALGQTTMAGSQPVVIASNQSSVPVTHSAVSASGNITTQNLVPAGVATAGSAVELTLSTGYSMALVQVTGTYTGALSLQYTVDNTNWVTHATGNDPAFFNLNTGLAAFTIGSATTGIFKIPVAGANKVRITGLAAMTGTATVTINATIGNWISQANQTINQNLVGGSTILVGNGVTGSGSQRVTVASDNTPFTVLTTENRPATATLTNVASSATSVTCLASNANRRKAMFFNDSTQVAFLKFGATASSTSYTVKMLAGGYYEIPTPVYTGIVDCIWAAANGNMRVTEY